MPRWAQGGDVVFLRGNHCILTTAATLANMMHPISTVGRSHQQTSVALLWIKLMNSRSSSKCSHPLWKAFSRSRDTNRRLKWKWRTTTAKKKWAQLSIGNRTCKTSRCQVSALRYQSCLPRRPVSSAFSAPQSGNFRTASGLCQRNSRSKRTFVSQLYFCNQKKKQLKTHAEFFLL